MLDVTDRYATCAFWDEDIFKWSDEGVTEERLGMQIACNTTHLSIFAGVLKVVVRRRVEAVLDRVAVQVETRHVSDSGFNKGLFQI